MNNYKLLINFNYLTLNQTFTTTYGSIHLHLGYPPACMRDPACNRGPASIGTSESDPRPVCGARRLSGARLLSEVLRYISHKLAMTLENIILQTE